MSLWLMGILCGFVTGKAFVLTLVGFVWIRLFAGFVIIFAVALRGNARTYALLASGFSYGAVHNPPLPEKPFGLYTVVHVDDFASLPAYGLVADGNGRIWKAYVQKEVGQEGILTCLPRVDLLQKRTCFMARSDEKGRATDSESVRRSLSEYFMRYPAPLGQWLVGAFLGDRKAFETSVKQLYKEVGLYHVMIASGLHAALVFWCLLSSLLLPGWLLYNLKGMPAYRWPAYQEIAGICAAAGVVFYGWVVGYGVPAQRAVLIFLLGRYLGLRSALLWAIGVQIFLFPVSAYSSSLVLSWGSYLIFRRLAGGVSLSGLIIAQMMATLLVFSVIGTMYLMGVFCNILLLPFLLLLLVLSIAACVLCEPSAAIFSWLSFCLEEFAVFLTSIAKYSPQYSASGPVECERVAALAIVGLYLWNPIQGKAIFAILKSKLKEIPWILGKKRPSSS